MLAFKQRFRMHVICQFWNNFITFSPIYHSYLEIKLYSQGPLPVATMD
jgi:hypothetical protein